MRCPRALAALAALALGSGCTLVRTYSGNEMPPAIDTQIATGATKA